MPVKQPHTAANEFLHAACIVALADTTAGYARLAHLPDGASSFTTIELKSNFLGTVREGSIACVATTQHLGRSTHSCHCQMESEADPKDTSPASTGSACLRHCGGDGSTGGCRTKSQPTFTTLLTCLRLYLSRTRVIAPKSLTPQ